VFLPSARVVHVSFSTPCSAAEHLQEGHVSVHPIDYLVHVSNLLLLVSYSVRDILWLRWFAVAAALTNIPYFLFQPEALWPPVLWALVFTTMNLYQIVRLYMERRPVVLSEDEQRLYDMGFHALRPREFVALVLAGEWKNAAADDRVLTEGQPVSSVCIAISGTVHVRRQDHHLGALGPGHVIGAAIALTGEPSPVEAAFTETGRYMCWPLSNLRSFLDKRPEPRVTLQRLVNRDLAGKLEGLLSR
jgi:CRP-like cAMP-binding protein